MAVSIRGLNKSFEENKILVNFILDLPDAGVVCIAGPSGCGKTTLINILLGIMPADSGEITGIDGMEISCVFQEDRLLPWLSLAENVMLVSEDIALCEKWISKMELSESMDKYPAELSGGMRRRCSLARAMVRLESAGCGILILDEPFKGLDYELKERIIAEIMDTVKNILVIIITHDREEAESMTDNIIEMKERK